MHMAVNLDAVVKARYMYIYYISLTAFQCTLYNGSIHMCNVHCTTVQYRCVMYMYFAPFVFGGALSWGSAFAVCIVQCSLVYQLEHSGKVQRAWLKLALKIFSLHCYQVRPHSSVLR